ncbi:MAG: hypothetical protein ACRCYY_21305 [Trueperaceae bacterium]
MVRFVRTDKAPQLLDIQPLELLPPQPSLPLFRVKEPGLLDLVIDEGRFFAARFGLARSGVLDVQAARVANACVGNKQNEALLELTLRGPVLAVLRDAVIALTGFGMTCFLDNEEIASATSVLVKKGQRLSYRSNLRGARAYLAVVGGLARQGQCQYRCGSWHKQSFTRRGRVGCAASGESSSGL